MLQWLLIALGVVAAVALIRFAKKVGDDLAFCLGHATSRDKEGFIRMHADQEFIRKHGYDAWLETLKDAQ